MNNEKAREFFSSYYEDTLEGGLKQTFERKLLSDPELKAEYRLFEATLSELDALKLEEIEIPYGLHDTIAARLDRHLYEQKRLKPAGISVFWRNLAFGGIAVAAIAGAVFGLQRSGTKGSAQANLIGDLRPAQVAATRIDFKSSPNSVLVEFTPATEETLTIESSATGKVLQQIDVKGGQQSTTPLQNPQPRAAVLGVRVPGEPTERWIALPGQTKSLERNGQGDLRSLAKAIADYYGVPVLVDVADPSASAHWSLIENDATHAAMDALAETKLTIAQGDDGKIVTISDH